MLYGASDFDGREVWFIKKILRILVIKEQINEINSKVFHEIFWEHYSMINVPLTKISLYSIMLATFISMML